MRPLLLHQRHPCYSRPTRRPFSVQLAVVSRAFLLHHVFAVLATTDLCYRPCLTRSCFCPFDSLRSSLEQDHAYYNLPRDCDMRAADMLSAFLGQLLACIVIVTSESLPSDQCHSLGYASNNLMCSSCNDLKQFKLGDMEDSCRQCCTNEDTDQREAEAKNKYHRAVLEVCS